MGPMTGYVRRVVDDELDELMAGMPAIALAGAKGVGKTSTARQRGGSHFALDNPTTLEVVRAEPERMLRGPEPIVIDEWQKFAPSWDLVRRSVDDDTRPGRFVLTGSASLASPSTHSGAGRIVSVRMRPLTLAERGLRVSYGESRRALEGGSAVAALDGRDLGGLHGRDPRRWLPRDARIDRTGAAGHARRVPRAHHRPGLPRSGTGGAQPRCSAPVDVRLRRGDSDGGLLRRSVTPPRRATVRSLPRPRPGRTATPSSGCGSSTLSRPGCRPNT